MIEQYVVPNSPGRQSAIALPREGAAGGEVFVREASDWIFGEPLVRELLHDPLIHAILGRDGLSLQDLLQAIDVGRRRLVPALAAESDAA